MWFVVGGFDAYTVVVVKVVWLSWSFQSDKLRCCDDVFIVR